LPGIFEEEDIAMFGFVLGALTGGLAIWYWGDQIREFATSNMSGARKRAADALSSLTETAERVPERTREQFGSAVPPRTGTVNPTSSR
jgi:hypothetical protein